MLISIAVHPLPCFLSDRHSITKRTAGGSLKRSGPCSSRRQALSRHNGHVIQLHVDNIAAVLNSVKPGSYAEIDIPYTNKP
jgi:hypothetical protein